MSKKSMKIKVTSKKDFLEEVYPNIYNFSETIAMQLPKIKEEVIVIIQALTLDPKIDPVCYQIIWKKFFNRKADYRKNKQNYRYNKTISFSLPAAQFVNSVIPDGMQKLFVNPPWLIRGYILEEITNYALRRDNIFDQLKELRKELESKKQKTNVQKSSDVDKEIHSQNIKSEKEFSNFNKDLQNNSHEELDDEDFENIMQF